jgi:DNA-directed RNA polymerase specialized sigma24 family protein
VQEVFLRFFIHKHKIDPSKIKAWLTVTSQNLAKDLFNKYKRQKTDVCHNLAVDTLETLWNCDDPHEQQKLIEHITDLAKNHSLRTLQEFYFKSKPVSAIAIERNQKVSSITAALCRERKVLVAALQKIA